MKSEFQAKFLQNLLKKRENEGFTLIELLVVIIIIGILSAIAIPSFLNQRNKAHESEAKQYTGSLNRSQQAYYLEKNTFHTDINVLGVGIQTQTTNYRYFITDATTGATAQNISANGSNSTTHMINAGAPINTVNLRSFIGAVDVVTPTGGSATTTTVLCSSPNPSVADATQITVDTSASSATQPSCNNYDDISN